MRFPQYKVMQHNYQKKQYIIIVIDIVHNYLLYDNSQNSLGEFQMFFFL